MPRPRKQTVDYFPHYAGASDGKTLYILQSRFGNDGYAFWFKLLELLATSEGHYYSFRNTTEWQFLVAKTGVSAEVCQEILDLLVDLGAIDSGLYQDKVIWCQKFVDNLAEVYRKRTMSFPSRPVVSDGKTIVSAAETGVSGDGNPQMKVNEMKLDEMKVGSSSSEKPLEQTKETAHDAYEHTIGELSEAMDHEIDLACSIYSSTWVIDAITEAARQNKRSWTYIAGILKNWRRYGRKKGRDDPDRFIRGRYGKSVLRELEEK